MQLLTTITFHPQFLEIWLTKKKWAEDGEDAAAGDDEKREDTLKKAAVAAIRYAEQQTKGFQEKDENDKNQFCYLIYIDYLNIIQLF